MRNLILASIIASTIIFLSCSGDPVKNVQSIPSLISEKFISDTEYEIVCIGYPKAGLKGIQKEESAKRAAILNAYYFSKNRFDDTVNADLDGKVEKFSMFEDYAEIKYVLKKNNLNKRLKK